MMMTSIQELKMNVHNPTKKKGPVIVLMMMMAMNMMMMIVMMMMMIVMMMMKTVHIPTNIRRGACSPCIRFLPSSQILMLAHTNK